MTLKALDLSLERHKVIIYFTPEVSVDILLRVAVGGDFGAHPFNAALHVLAVGQELLLEPLACLLLLAAKLLDGLVLDRVHLSLQLLHHHGEPLDVLIIWYEGYCSFD